MNKRLRTIVVGGGIMGLSTARALMRMDHEVVLFEQGSLPNQDGSSYDDHRLIRYPYGSSGAYTKMVGEAYRAWDEVWRDLGKRHYEQTGTLVVRRDGEAWSGASAATLHAAGMDMTVLERDVCEKRFEHLVWENTLGAYYLDSGGTLFARKIVKALVAWLRDHGARLFERALVQSVDADRGSVSLSDGTSEQADAIVVTAGAWVLRLAPELAAALSPSRQIVIYLKPPPDSANAWIRSPMVLDLDGTPAIYIVPPRSDAGLKAGDHSFSRTGSPNEPRGIRPGEAEEVFGKCAGIVRDLDAYAIASGKDCFYTVAPEERFYIARSGKRWIVSACSGHGFKFGPVIGQAIAQCVTGQRSTAEVAAWAAGKR